MTDVGLDHLTRLKQVTTLAVKSTKVTAAGVQKSHRRSPGPCYRFGPRRFRSHKEMTREAEVGGATSSPPCPIPFFTPAPGGPTAARYGRRSSLFASASPTTSCFAGSHVSVRPSCIDRFARMQLAVEMCPCSMSATGFAAVSRRLQEVLPVPPQGRRDVPLQVLLGLVLGVLVLLDQRRAAQGRLLLARAGRTRTCSRSP